LIKEPIIDYGKNQFLHHKFLLLVHVYILFKELCIHNNDVWWICAVLHQFIEIFFGSCIKHNTNITTPVSCPVPSHNQHKQPIHNMLVNKNKWMNYCQQQQSTTERRIQYYDGIISTVLQSTKVLNTHLCLTSDYNC